MSFTIRQKASESTQTSNDVNVKDERSENRTVMLQSSKTKTEEVLLDFYSVYDNK